MAEKETELTDDLLVAFADEALEHDEMERLAPLIAVNAEAIRKVEAFRRSGEQLRDFFSVGVSAETPPDIAEKIRAMEVSVDTADNVVSLEDYRQRLSRGFQVLASGSGLQKIAASLFVGVFVGLGGASQFQENGQAGVNDISQITVRGAGTPIGSTSGAVLLRSGSLSFVSGSTISIDKPYRIELNTAGAERISLIYHERNEAPVTLINRKSPSGKKTLLFPKVADDGIKIDTNAQFVTFETVFETKGQITRRFSVFGIE